jgi:hypothetical protein
MSERTGLSVGYLHYLEVGTRRITKDTAEILAPFLRCQPHKLLDWNLAPASSKKSNGKGQKRMAKVGKVSADGLPVEVA